MKRVTIVCVILVVLLTSRTESRGLDLIRDGRALCTIVVPEQATSLEKQAAQTLAKYLKMAAGAELPVATESPGVAGYARFSGQDPYGQGSRDHRPGLEV
jgi:hypothetical protein